LATGRKQKKPARGVAPHARKKPAPPPAPEPRPDAGRTESRKEDLQLIAAALRGEQAGYGTLMKKYRDPIFNLIFRIIRDREQVEDLTQETFVKAFASLGSFNREFAFSTWLYKIATNSSIDYIRKKKLQTTSINKPISHEDSDYTLELPDSTYEPDKFIIQRQKSKVIAEAIEKLPPKYRQVIILRHNEERDYAEIAKILKIPIGTVKAHIFRARELLYKALRERIPHY
jgi:RNA polymerase sigma factor (sigma-70 family)